MIQHAHNLVFHEVNLPQAIKAASKFSANGILKGAPSNYAYLKIDDAYIHQLFLLLNDNDITKPDFFGLDSIGAHISVVYPEENASINCEDIGQSHAFKVAKICRAHLGFKKYYVLMIESPSLLALRRKYKLSDKLCYKGYFLEFHITIGVGLL